MLLHPCFLIGRPELCDANRREIMAGEIISFGPYRLMATERLLTRDNMPVEIGGRALDILIALTDRRGQVLSKRELMNFVWPDATGRGISLMFQAEVTASSHRRGALSFRTLRPARRLSWGLKISHRFRPH
jgi:hypothetical protein